MWDKSATAYRGQPLPFLRYLPVDAIGDRTYRMVRTVVPERWLRTIYGVTDATRLAAAVPRTLASWAMPRPARSGGHGHDKPHPPAPRAIHPQRQAGPVRYQPR